MLTTITPTRRGLLPADALSAPWRALAHAADALKRRWQRHRDRRATQHGLDALSPRLLRDLGVDRSEIPSLAVAAGGHGDSTRVRMTQLARRQSALL